MSHEEDKDESAFEEEDVESVWDLGLGEVFSQNDDEEEETEHNGWCGRFRLLDEIARGGMGIVYRARDDRLERDVAIKVIRRDRIDENSAMARFLEEAQIAGQLQHPGIVPIYETGLDERDRPFFVMKLVKGETLTDVLKRRRTVEENLGHLIQIFSSLCQTISFAHARGVIHRDLKPSNIMIGAFGEVQVLDWGFAKLIKNPNQSTPNKQPRNQNSLRTIRSSSGSSESMSGSVLGTPGYMSPEQARGEIDEIDERCDVFALGGILCEILTGAPPHLPESGVHAATIAAKGDMKDAVTRISAADGPREIKELSIWCLEPVVASRPRNAFIVADVVASYIDKLEEDLQGAKIETQAAHHKLIEERKARRLTMALGALVILVLLVSGGLWWNWITARNEDLIEMRTNFEGALRTANLRSQEKSWDAMEEALRRADLILLRDNGPKDLHTKLALTREQLSSHKKAALAKEKASLAQETFAKEIDHIRQLPIDDPNVGRKEYAAAFTTFGIDMEKHSPESAFRRLDPQPPYLRRKILAALDDWAARERQAGGRSASTRNMKAQGPESLWSKLVSTSQLLDTDPWRRRLRSVALENDRKALLELAREKGLEKRNTQSILLLAISLVRENERQEALHVLWLGFVAHPDDFWINHHIAMLASRNRPLGVPLADQRSQADIDMATRHAWIALSLQPGSVFARKHLVIALLRSGETKNAVEVMYGGNRVKRENLDRTLSDIYFQVSAKTELEFLRTAARIHPEHDELWPRLAMANLAAGDFAASIKAAKAGIDLGGLHEGLPATWARALADQGNLEGALKVIDGHKKSIRLSRLRKRIQDLQVLRKMGRPLDTPSLRGSIDRARTLTWNKLANEASNAWLDAIARGRRRGPGRQGSLPPRGTLGPQPRGIERDALASLLWLARQENINSDMQAKLWERALSAASRFLDANEAGLSGSTPFVIQRERSLWLADPRLTECHGPNFPVFLPSEERQRWLNFWQTLAALEG